ncbi:MAG: phage portal protein [Solirubrobacteraceae bacterium]
MADYAQQVQQVETLAAELDRRGVTFRRLERYKGECPVPQVIRRMRATNAYRLLMDFAQTNYGRLVVRAATSRMRVGGVRTGDEKLDEALWAIWHDNHMDSESRLGHDVALTHGRCFAIVWPGENGNSPKITLESPDTCIVEYAPGSRHERVAALRRWKDSAGTHATLYRPNGVWKFTSGEDGKWQPRQSEGDPSWPLPVPEGQVRVVEIATNRELRATPYGHAHGDFEGNTGLIDRILILDFLRLVIAFTSGFPIRAVIGDKIQYKKDDSGGVLLGTDGKPIAIAPFELAADVIAQFENPQAKLEELKAGDLKSFGEAIDRDVESLAGLTQTPFYYLHQVPIHNVSADAIRASDAPLMTRVEEHQPNIGDGWREVLALAGAQANLQVPANAEVVWLDRQSRSLAERADAATKLSTVLPWRATAEIALDADQETINRWAEEKLADQLLNPPPPAGGNPELPPPPNSP